jgi:hypothetical protein
MIANQVGHNRQQPCGYTAVPAKEVTLFEGAHEALLCDGLGQVDIAQPIKCKGQHPRPVSLHEPIDIIEIRNCGGTLCAIIHQSGIGHHNISLNVISIDLPQISLPSLGVLLGNLTVLVVRLDFGHKAAKIAEAAYHGRNSRRHG